MLPPRGPPAQSQNNPGAPTATQGQKHSSDPRAGTSRVANMGSSTQLCPAPQTWVQEGRAPHICLELQQFSKQSGDLRDVPNFEALGGTEVRGRPWFIASDREKWHTVTEVLQKQNEKHRDGKSHWALIGLLHRRIAWKLRAQVF